MLSTKLSVARTWRVVSVLSITTLSTPSMLAFIEYVLGNVCLLKSR